MAEDLIREKYINPYTDFGFKKLFGTEMNKDLLISFLNSLFSGRKAEIAKYTPRERQEYAESIKNYWDYYSTMKTAHKKGIAEGMEKGLEKGRAEGRTEGRAEGEYSKALYSARKMKSKGFTVEDIADITGLTPEEVTAML